jgi:hypothetical protein
LEKRRPDFEQEIDAFQGLQGNRGVIHSFGSFEYGDAIYKNRRTFNIVLEFGQRDLYELFLDQNPPQSAEEIIRSWAAIIEVAKTIRSVHEFKNKGDSYRGYGVDLSSMSTAS